MSNAIAVPDPQEIVVMIRDGIQGMRIIEPEVKLVFKDVSWESTGDAEFRRALAEVLPEEDRTGWFEVYSAARERESIKGAGQESLFR